MHFNEIQNSLEEKGWFYQENFINKDLCKKILKTCLGQAEGTPLTQGKIGNKKVVNANTSIRDGSIMWINYLDKNHSQGELNSLLSQIMFSTNKYFRLSLKRFESQFATYDKGGFYKPHLDQHKQARHRQITCCLYLNDCVDGGEFVIYKKGSKTNVEKIIKPLKGGFVLFFSADIYHEVKTVNDQRLSITTWFRDDEEFLTQ